MILCVKLIDHTFALYFFSRPRLNVFFPIIIIFFFSCSTIILSSMLNDQRLILTISEFN
jgi:hypothetical protein